MVIYIDDDLLVINKPAGILSIQDGYDRTLPHLSTLLDPYFGRIWIIDRLDKDTSGVLLLGRNSDTHRILNEKFKERSITKIYHSLILGNPEWDELMVDLPLKTNADRLHRTRVDQNHGKPAKTFFCVKSRYTSFSLLECNLFSGYTHQIRAHLFSLNFPILGDTFYCQKSQRELLRSLFPHNRIALHAKTITIEHPRSREVMTFTAPYPIEISELLE